MNLSDFGNAPSFPLALLRNAIWTLFFLYSPFVHGQLAISNLHAAQRLGTNLVDIDYDLTGIVTPISVSLQASADGGLTWTVPLTSLAGAIGANVAPDTGLRITWDAGTDWNEQFSTNVRFRITADDLTAPPPPEGFVPIPAGHFEMGDSFSEGTTYELPVHNLYVSAFYMGK